MIDCHCHLEQEEYNGKREQIIEECKKHLRAIVTCCAHPKDLNLTLELVKKYKNFVFCSVGIHPEYVKEISESEINDVIEKIDSNKKFIVAIGEVGLDYYWVKEKEWQEKQKILFKKFILLAKKFELPLVIHSRNATEDAIKILEEEGMKHKKVLMHLFTDRKFLQKVLDNGWFVTIGQNILRSKNAKKIARDTPLNRILLETDSPWFAQQEQEYSLPTNVKIVGEKIAEIKKIKLEEVEKQTDLNAINFFNLIF